jgi:16S rRNA (cytosine967-C5)-methyltransferase
VLGEGRLLDDALAESRDLATLQPRDRAFVRVLAATTLRRLGQIDGLVDHCLDRPLKARPMPPSTAPWPWPAAPPWAATGAW